MSYHFFHFKCLYVSSVWLLWWCDIHRLVQEHVLQLQQGQPQQRTLLCPLLLLCHIPRQGHLLLQTLLKGFVFYMFIYICMCLYVQMVINTMCGQGMQELDYAQAGNHIHTNGCIDKMVNWIHSNLFFIGGIALGMAIPQVGHCVQCILYTSKHTCCIKDYSLM